jgi:hypothetical protein
MRFGSAQQFPINSPEKRLLSNIEESLPGN